MEDKQVGRPRSVKTTAASVFLLIYTHSTLAVTPSLSWFLKPRVVRGWKWMVIRRPFSVNSVQADEKNPDQRCWKEDPIAWKQETGRSQPFNGGSPTPLCRIAPQSA